MDVIDLPLEQIIPYARNPRRNEKAVATVAAFIAEFGWRQPIVVDEHRVVLAGHTRLEAARQLGLDTVAVHIAKGLSEHQVRAFRIMDNRSSENAEWDDELLGLELGDLLEGDYDLELTGFTDDELAALMNALSELARTHCPMSMVERCSADTNFFGGSPAPDDVEGSLGHGIPHDEFAGPA